mmetsp:Transcript_45290/g.144139  ORF Transcript_45290/g.144139 Transcript_45290/m.144139 type:complete len:279 (+) Transcript_45290:76-912(+)
MAPLDPMREPTTVRRSLLSMKPSAQRAQPLYELSTVITTGMSAPPMATAMCHPRPPERRDAAERAAMPVPAASGEPAPMKATAEPAEPMRAAALMASLPGMLVGADLRRPWSFPKAAREPVRVTPPMKVPAKMAPRCTPSSACAPCSASMAVAGSIAERYEAAEVVMAARPTREWNPATVCGRSVTCMLRAMPYPTAPPPPTIAAICAKVAGSAPHAPRAAPIPVATPMSPAAFPRGAVAWLLSPAMPPMQPRAEAMYAIWGSLVMKPATAPSAAGAK